MVSEVDLAYAAGIVDGEGCIMAKPDRRRAYGTNYQLSCKVEMSERETIEWFSQTFGGGIGQPKRSKAHFRQTYRWEICGKKCIKFLHLISPYMRGKKKQALLAMTWPYSAKHQKKDSHIRLQREGIYFGLQQIKQEMVQ